MSIDKYIVKGHPVVADSSNTGEPLEKTSLSLLPDLVLSNAARISKHGMGETHIVDPTPANDSYDIGAFWKNTATQKMFYCISNAPSNAIWLNIATETAPEIFEADYFVDPILGDNSNDGSLSLPFETIARARDAIRTDYSGGLTKDITVALRDGTHRVTGTLVLNGELDSGTDEYSITYLNFPDEEPVIKGSYAITGTWTLDSPYYYVDLPGQAPFYTFYADNKMKQLAKFPTTGFAMGVAYPGGTSPSIYNYLYVNPADEQTGILATEDVYMLHGVGSIVTRLPVTNPGTYSTDGGGRRINLATSAVPPLNYRSDYGRYYLVNSKSFLTDPGEWFYDTTAERLYYYPEPGEDPNSVLTEIPVTTTILELQGKENGFTSDNVNIFSFWFRTNYSASPVFKQYMVMHNKNTGIGFECALRDKPGLPCYPYMALSSRFMEHTAATGCNDGDWHHFCGVIDAANAQFKIFLDGVSSPVFNTGNPPIPPNKPLSLFWQNTTDSFSGDIDEMVILTRSGGAAISSTDANAIGTGNYDGFNIAFRMPFELDYTVESPEMQENSHLILYQGSISSSTAIFGSDFSFISGAPNTLGNYGLHANSNFNASYNFGKIGFQNFAGIPIKNVKFKGLTFTQTDRDLTLLSNQYGDELDDAESGAILIERGIDCTFEDCTVKEVSSLGFLVNYSRGIDFIGNSIHDCGYAGITTVGDFTVKNPMFGFGLYDSNEIYNCGLFHPLGGGLLTYHCGNNEQRYNHIYNCGYAGIRNFSTLNSLISAGGGNKVHHNHIHDCMQRAYDGSAIFGAGYQKNTDIHHNHIHNMVFTQYHNDPLPGASGNGITKGGLRGIYLDESTTDAYVHHNLVYDVQVADLFLHKNRGTYVYNNKFLEPLGWDFNPNGIPSCIDVNYRSSSGVQTSGPYGVLGSGTELAPLSYWHSSRDINIFSNVCQSSLGYANVVYTAPVSHIEGETLPNLGVHDYNMNVNNKYGHNNQGGTYIEYNGDDWNTRWFITPSVPNDTPIETNTISGDPNWANYQKKDFRLPSSSPIMNMLPPTGILVNGVQVLPFEEFEVPDLR